jgi:hypothetical protein
MFFHGFLINSSFQTGYFPGGRSKCRPPLPGFGYLIAHPFASAENDIFAKKFFR